MGSTRTGRFLSNAVEWFVPEGLHSTIDTLRRARLAVSFSLLFGIFVFVFCAATFTFAGFSRTPMLVVTAVAGCLVLLLPVLLRATGRLGLVGNAIAALLVLPVTVMYLRSGGFGMPGAFILSLAPMVALLLAGRGSAIAWAMICVAEIHLFAHLRRSGYDFPIDLDVATLDFAQTIGAVVLVFAVLSVALCYESLSSKAFAALTAANHDLEEARDRALDGARAKASFLATMSHEIRTPMNGVIGMSNLLLDTRLSEEQRELAEAIRTSGDSLLTILNDILDFSKIEAGKIDLERCPFEVRPCLEEALDLFGPKAAEKGLELLLDVAPSVPPWVSSDPTRLRQVVVNLLGNAVKFTEAGEILLAVEARPLPDERVELQFAVRDTGIGIAQEHIGRLFESFSQADASTTRHYGGTGLGLAISKRLTEIMGGRMWVESVPGTGSTFHFITVVEKASAVPGRTSQVELAAPGFAGRRVLLVDDNQTNLRLLGLQTERWTMQSMSVSSPFQAEALVASGEQFDIAILDMLMPGMDGLDLAVALRRLPEGKDLPIVMLTSIVASDMAARASERGIDLGEVVHAVLTKPVKTLALANTLARALGVGARPAAPAAPSQIDPELAARLPLRILLAEDNPINQKVAVHLLSRMGYRPEVASNGLEAIQALARQTFDVVLMDVQMPEMDGLDATREIRRRFTDADIWVIGLTAGALPEDRARCLAAGMDDYLAKPFKPQELAAKLVSRGADHGRGGEHDTASARESAPGESPVPRAKFPPLAQAS